MIDKIKAWLFRKSLRWYIDEKLDQWDRIEIHTKNKTVWLQLSLKKPDNYKWDILK